MKGPGFVVKGSGFRIQGGRLRAQGVSGTYLGLRVYDSGYLVRP